MMSFLMSETGTVHVGLRLTAVTRVSTIGEGRSTLPTIAT